MNRNRKPIKCGTPWGYSHHRKRKEPACEACLQARREFRKKEYAENAEKFRSLSKIWRINNPDKAFETNKKQNDIRNRKRRAHKASVISEAYTDKEVLEKYGSICHICGIGIDLSIPRKGKRANWGESLHIDHVIPLSKGGPDTLDNVRPSHAFCNISKGSKMMP